jgi:hypothetical protein
LIYSFVSKQPDDFDEWFDLCIVPKAKAREAWYVALHRDTVLYLDFICFFS